MLIFEQARDAAADAVREQVRELVTRWRVTGRFVPRVDNWMRGFDPAFSRELGRSGLIGITWPRTYGGRGARNVDRLAATEELLRAGAPVAAHWIGDRQIGPAVLRHGTPQLRAELLPGIVRGEAVHCLGMSEPEAGSDLASVTTSGRPDGDGWILRGRKVWTTGAHHASHMYVLARTGHGERKHHGLTEFVIDMDSPGVHVSPIPDLTGEHHFNEVLLDEVRVPAARVLGTEGNGWRQVVEQLSFERGGPERILSSYPLLEQLLADAGDEHAGAVGEAVARVATLRRLAFRVARLMDDGHAPVQEAATLKLLGNTVEQDLVELARTVHGGPLRAGSPIGRAVAAMPGFSIRGGAADVLLGIIARQEAA